MAFPGTSLRGGTTALSSLVAIPAKVITLDKLNTKVRDDSGATRLYAFITLLQCSTPFSSLPLLTEGFYAMERTTTSVVIEAIGLVNKCICSAQSGNLRNLEIALRILRIPRLRTVVTRSRDCTIHLRNLEIAQVYCAIFYPDAHV